MNLLFKCSGTFSPLDSLIDFSLLNSASSEHISI